jgi:hypothetical protein
MQQSHSNVWRRIGYVVSFLAVAGVAAYVSFGHIYEVTVLAHQPLMLARVMPLSVDGLMLIATLAMAEDKAASRHPRGWARFGFWFGAGVSTAANVAATAVRYHDPLSIAVAAFAPLALLLSIEIVARPGKPKVEQPRVSPEQVRVTPGPVRQAQQVVAAEVTRLPVPVSPAPQGRVTPEDRAPLQGREVISPLTGRVLTERPPRK